MNKAVKWGLIAIALAVVGNILKEAVKATNEVDAKIAFETSCERQAKSGGTIPAEKAKAVCSCTSERTSKQLGLPKFAKVLKAGNDAPQSDKLILSSNLINCAKDVGGVE
jgi:hypothetical protein